MKTPLLSLLTALSLSMTVGAFGCSSAAEEAESDVDQGALGIDKHSGTSGEFSVRMEGHTVKLEYKLEWDLPAKTVLWNAKVKDNGGLRGVTDDTNEKGTITAVARCECSFSATIPGPSGDLAVVEVGGGKVTGITYEGERATLARPDAAPSGPTAAASGDSPDDMGACTLNGGTCKEVRRDECKIGSPKFDAQRGRMLFEFKEGESCGPAHTG